MPIEVVAFDGDDTLWHSETHFALTHERFCRLLSPYASPDELSERMLTTERRNLEIFGYGVKGYTLSMIETAIEVSGGAVTAGDIQVLIDAGKEMLRHPTELLDGVRSVVEELSLSHRLVLVTKGDLFHQESKLAASGLGELFERVEIVSEKDERTYRRVVCDLGIPPDRFLMVGNSLRSDVLPVVRIGARAVHVPYVVDWAHELVEEADLPSEGWWRLASLDGLADLLPALG